MSKKPAITIWCLEARMKDGVWRFWCALRGPSVRCFYADAVHYLNNHNTFGAPWRLKDGQLDARNWRIVKYHLSAVTKRPTAMIKQMDLNGWDELCHPEKILFRPDSP